MTANGETADTTERLLYEDGQLRVFLRARCEVPVLALRGEIDITNSWALAQTLAAARESGTHILVDTSELTFIDLSGLRVLALPMLDPAERWIRLRNLTPFQRRLLSLLGWC
ncbi:STAS domain-containing protein [Nonomuraea sp. NEAU-A123]|uniref:STAS domain-containing protein n=1 Tax=Nonomuraea sp. NEAU-A123 TaxID=2839649 RepID=UPI001BE41CE1|nr:STAS domain-containing protein [Nonomuraea sp. NEAU-A123]MBT2234578.1 STAS domain-containing protein [Nonomuraea sp. NEAU-A123]